MPFIGGSVYAMSKGAVAAFTKGLARDLGARKITVNNVQPGPTDTDMNPAHTDFAKATLPMLALGRYGRTDEIAASSPSSPARKRVTSPVPACSPMAAMRHNRKLHHF